MWAAIIPAVTSVIGGAISSSANSSAARTAAQAQTQSAAIQSQAIQRAQQQYMDFATQAGTLAEQYMREGNTIAAQRQRETEAEYYRLAEQARVELAQA